MSRIRNPRLAVALFALLVLVLSIGAPGPVESTSHEITKTVTAGAGYGYSGYLQLGGRTVGSIDSPTFSYGETTFTIHYITYESSTGSFYVAWSPCSPTEYLQGFGAGTTIHSVRTELACTGGRSSWEVLDDIGNPFTDGTDLAVSLILNTPPAAPTGVTVTPGEERLTIGWSGVSDAAGYEVQWKTGTLEYSTDRQLSTAETSLTILDLTDGATYDVRVRATKTGAASGAWSPDAAGIPVTFSVTGPDRVTGGHTVQYTAVSTDPTQRLRMRACGVVQGEAATGGTLTLDISFPGDCYPNEVALESETPLDSGSYVDRAKIVLAVTPNRRSAGFTSPSDAPRIPSTGSTPTPPRQRHWRDKLCYGFPGCPDSFLFLIPALAMALAFGKTRSIYGLAGVFVLVFILTAVILQVNMLRVIIYIAVAIFAGVIWLAFGGLKR